MKRSKYGNRKTSIDDIRFDSKAEARRYTELKLLLRAGEIANLRLQPRYELQPKFKRNGKTVRAIYYVGDFEYEVNGKCVVEDVKGKATAVFKLKKKLFEFRYSDIELRIVSA